MMEFETLNTDKLLMMMKVWICAKKKIVVAECHLHRRRRASWFTSQIFFAHNSWSSRSKDQLSWACNNNDIIEEYNTKEADQLS